MRLLQLVRRALNACVAAASFVGCSSQEMPGAPLWSYEGSRAGTNAATGDLLYVSDGAYVYVYSYPQGAKVQALQQGGADGLCVDTRGDVFMTLYQAAEIVEYAHGGSSPIATLTDPNPRPIGCSVDPQTGDLAVTDYAGSGPSNPGSVVIYPNARGSGAIYTDPALFFYSSCTYDASGNLFIDGQTDRFKPVIAEIPRGGSTFTNISLPKQIRAIALLGGIQWDGKHLAVGDLDRSIVYRLRVSGSRAHVIGSAKLKGGNRIYQFAVQGARLIGPNSAGNTIKFWKYPSGGRAVKTIDAYYGLFGATISPPSR